MHSGTEKNGEVGGANYKGWRDRVGIEPTGDVTRLPEGFEDLGKHQLHIRPRMIKAAKPIILFSP